MKLNLWKAGLTSGDMERANSFIFCFMLEKFYALGCRRNEMFALQLGAICCSGEILHDLAIGFVTVFLCSNCSCEYLFECDYYC